MTLPEDEIHFCVNRGSLVNATKWLPTNPFDYHWGRINAQIGCNRIRCARCGQLVTSTVDGDRRNYRCECTSYDETSLTILAGDPSDITTFDNPNWACVGHPPLALPATLDGLAVDPGRFREVARAGLADPPPLPFEKPGDVWVSRLYWILPQTVRGAFSAAIGELLLDDHMRVVVRAMSFYIEQRMAPGSERLAPLYRDHGPRLAAIADPDSPDYTVEDQLLSSLKYRGFQRDDSGQLEDPEAHEQLRQAVLAGKNPDEVIYTFGRLEPEWLAANAAEIVRNAPKLLGDVAYLIRFQPVDVRRPAYAAIAQIDRAELIKQLNDFFRGYPELEQIIADLPG